MSWRLATPDKPRKLLEARAQTRRRPMKIVASSQTPISPAWIESKADVVSVCSAIASVHDLLFDAHRQVCQQCMCMCYFGIPVTIRSTGPRVMTSRLMQARQISRGGVCLGA